MSSYRRAKRNDVIKLSKKEMAISIGSVNDSFEVLKQMCNDKSVELLKAIEIEKGEEMDVVFWTADYPELIGVSTFTKMDTELLSFSLDFSMTTL